MVYPMSDKIMLPSYYHHIVFTLICSMIYCIVKKFVFSMTIAIGVIKIIYKVKRTKSFPICFLLACTFL